MRRCFAYLESDKGTIGRREQMRNALVRRGGKHALFCTRIDRDVVEVSVIRKFRCRIRDTTGYSKTG